MSIKVGNKADGEDFFGRRAERESLWDYLGGNHVVLSGPRRLGKTSLLQRIAEEAPERGLLARLIDVEGVVSTEAFIAELERAFPDDGIQGHLKAAGSSVKGWFDRIRKVDAKLPGGFGGGFELKDKAAEGWHAGALALQRRLSEAPVLILIDEFSVFLEGLLKRAPDEAEQLLGWLRAWRQQPNLACRFVFSGSIGLNALLIRHRLITRFNDCHDFQLGPFKRSAALDMLTALAQREGWPAGHEVVSHLCDRAGWLSPFYVNLLLVSAIEAARDRLLETREADRTLLRSDVDDGFDRLLATRSRFVHWQLRLRDRLAEPELSFTLGLLALVAGEDLGMSRQQLRKRLHRMEADPDRLTTRLEDALLMLEEDGYLDAGGEQVKFLSFLLRDYWRRNHGN